MLKTNKINVSRRVCEILIFGDNKNASLKKINPDSGFKDHLLSKVFFVDTNAQESKSDFSTYMLLCRSEYCFLKRILIHYNVKCIYESFRTS